jgi:hypothetical protein
LSVNRIATDIETSCDVSMAVTGRAVKQHFNTPSAICKGPYYPL